MLRILLIVCVVGLAPAAQAQGGSQSDETAPLEVPETPDEITVVGTQQDVTNVQDEAQAVTAAAVPLARTLAARGLDFSHDSISVSKDSKRPPCATSS